MVSLFAGIGGFDLAAEWTDRIEVVGQVEIADYPTRVLERHWPDVPRIRDVRDYAGHEFGPVDLITGGYPCQPFSFAGRRDGTADPRHLWPEVARIIRAARPRWVLLENVPGHLSLGFGEVLGDLATLGYDAEWDCIPASAVGAPHRRDRLWVLAYTQSPRSQEPPRKRAGATGFPRSERGGVGGVGEALHWSVEPAVGRMADGIPKRVDRIKALGNAIVPQIAYPIFQRILASHPRQEQLDGP